MSVTHVRVGDPGKSETASLDSYTCNCACQVCMSGSCCRYQQHPGTVTTTTSGAVLPTACNPTDHDFSAVILPSSGSARLYCRKCGVTRKIE